MQKKRIIRTILGVTLSATIGFSTLLAGHVPSAQAATTTSQELIAYGKEYVGVPYRLGSPSGSTRTFDCSSFTQYIFKKFDVKLNRTSSAQAKQGKAVAKSSLSMGDLVFFNTSGRGISHVGIYAGSNKMLHASSSKGITLTNMNSSYWKNKYVTARRVL